MGVVDFIVYNYGIVNMGDSGIRLRILLLVVCSLVLFVSQLFGNLGLVYLMFLGGLLYVGFLVQVIGISGWGLLVLPLLFLIDGRFFMLLVLMVYLLV